MLNVVHRAIEQWEIDTYLIDKDIADLKVYNIGAVRNLLCVNCVIITYCIILILHMRIYHTIKYPMIWCCCISRIDTNIYWLKSVLITETQCMVDGTAGSPIQYDTHKMNHTIINMIRMWI